MLDLCWMWIVANPGWSHCPLCISFGGACLSAGGAAVLLTGGGCEAWPRHHCSAPGDIFRSTQPLILSLVSSRVSVKGGQPAVTCRR